MSKKFRNVLLVDDDEIANYLHQLVLEELDLSEQIFTAFDGQQALKLLRDHCISDPPSSAACPDVVFLDLNMPGMDGFEFLDEFEKNLASKGKIRVIVVTSSNNEKDIQKASVYSIAGYINKPLTVDKIQEVLDSVS